MCRAKANQVFLFRLPVTETNPEVAQSARARAVFLSRLTLCEFEHLSRLKIHWWFMSSMTIRCEYFVKLSSQFNAIANLRFSLYISVAGFLFVTFFQAMANMTLTCSVYNSENESWTVPVFIDDSKVELISQIPEARQYRYGTSRPMTFQSPAQVAEDY